jgi:hypothetical protein
MTTPMHITAQKVLFPLSCCVAIRHPGQVRLRRIRALLNFPEGTLFYRASRDPDNVPAKAGNQAPNEVIVGFLDSGHPPAANSGMTGSCSHVIPAQAGIQASFINLYLWIPDLAPRSEARPK